MRSKGLLSILTYSEKRKDILFLLADGPRTLSDIKEYFKVSSPEIFPRLKEMESSNMISKDDKIYSITPIGKAILKHYTPFLDILSTIEKNETFWKEHMLDDIPETLLENLSDLLDCEVVADSIENIYESHKLFKENIGKSSVLKGVSSIFIPSYPDFFVELVNNNVRTSLILTENVFFKVVTEHREKIEIYLNSPDSELYIIEDVRLAFVVTDQFFSMSLFFSNGSYDPRHDMVGHDASAIKWGNDLFEHYRKLSRRVTSI
ncbi:ArsR family transcriptional regulator [Methanolobus halotolerans]|uniref:ArsR family transcriptional regulator n=2 Tax=Methanolobus halotolerans TaxID=2052935 RepID=A0A4E0QRC9_9EURY|nr:ArsR family transcriptional regulator [Methanolobus halotolerans]